MLLKIEINLPNGKRGEAQATMLPGKKSNPENAVLYVYILAR
jgi:hypothetical protein